MRRGVACVLAALLAGVRVVAVLAATPDPIVLTLPHPPRAGDHLVVAVTVGPIGHRRIELTTASGQRLGTITAFGVSARESGGTYLLPVPLDAVRDDRLDLRLTITGDGEARSPTQEEVTAVRLTMTGP
jgi:hypothetical protein